MYLQENKQNYTLEYLSFQDYFTYFVNLKNTSISEYWGWFIDIESNCQNNYTLSQIKQPNMYNTSKYVNILPSINEIPSIRSLKSMRNLQDEAMIYKINNILDKKDNSKFISYFIHSVCVLGVFGVFYECAFL